MGYLWPGSSIEGAANTWELARGGLYLCLLALMLAALVAFFWRRGRRTRRLIERRFDVTFSTEQWVTWRVVGLGLGALLVVIITYLT